MHTMLMAAMVSSSNTHAHLAQKGACIHPPTEDPMSWDCDCWDEMLIRCKSIGAGVGLQLQMCLTAQYCSHGKICKHWWEEHCKENPQVDAMNEALRAHADLAVMQEADNTSLPAIAMGDHQISNSDAAGNALLHRGSTRSEGIDVERTLARKTCV